MDEKTQLSHSRRPDDGSSYDPLLPNGTPTANGLPSNALSTAFSDVPPTRWSTRGERVEQSDSNHLAGLLARRWKIILATFLTIVGLSVIYLLMAKPVYQSTATIQVKSAPQAGGGMGLGDLLGGFSAGRDVDTQVAILNNGVIIGGGMRRMPAELRERLKDYVSVRVAAVGRTDLITITALSYSQPAAKALADGIGAEYIDLSLKQNRATTREASNYVEAQLKSVRQRLTSATTALQNFKQVNRFFDLSKESNVMIDRLATLQASYQQTEAERNASMAQLNDLRSQVSRMPLEQDASRTIATPKVVDQLRAERTRLELELIAAGKEYVEGSPELRTIEQQIADVDRRLASVKQDETVSKSVGVNPIRQGLSTQIAGLLGTIQALEARSRDLRTSISRAEAQLKSWPARERQLGQYMTELESLRQTYQMLRQKREGLRLALEAQGSSASVLFEADMPGVPVFPDKKRILMMGIIGGLLLAFSLARFVDHLDDRIHSDADAEQTTRLPVLAHVPFIKDRAQINLLATHDETSPLVESYRMLRTNISFAEVDEPIRSIVVTSSLPGEGKSTNALNLAVAAALGGERVTLVDCDLRKPELHRLCGLPNEVGFTSVASGARTLQTCYQETDVPGLRVLTSGPTAANPFKMLNSRAGRAVIHQVIQEADFVIIDTPPALMLADARIVSTLTDAVILVISSQGARKREIARVRDLMAQTGSELLGTVLNKITVGFGSYYGSYNYLPQAVDSYLHGAHDGDLHDDDEDDSTQLVAAGNGHAARRKGNHG